MQNALQTVSSEAADKVDKQKHSSKGARSTTAKLDIPTANKRGSQNLSSSFATAAAAAAAATTTAPQTHPQGNLLPLTRKTSAFSNGTTVFESQLEYHEGVCPDAEPPEGVHEGDLAQGGEKRAGREREGDEERTGRAREAPQREGERDGGNIQIAASASLDHCLCRPHRNPNLQLPPPPPTLRCGGGRWRNWRKNVRN
uniref:Uncharacterized protein n=1 Tax=Chromera velia CCMP2878 TaxID=1169474 RepID=A0A0G4F2Q7_9ALVE|eukprot:Cvel_14854.t1-p1 / transcript=Cvel_14854.t1 / gene=Cvel_14854 / organism=Chromera_velia_CCMP2878 / gene_product=hypothetical protein / transcript_product=hypothetical protein / location=Cvel_scaffold1073:36726-38493(-) / protein_length=198 / sequence_SO=supercontig / SO=protein_coding / is_pseudo=false